MAGILAIAKREIRRVRGRFRGGSRLTVVLLLAASLGLSYLVAQQGFVPSRGLYRVAISPNGPRIRDPRFEVVVVNPPTGRALLQRGAVDAYLDDDTFLSGYSPKSDYAAGALKEYLERVELARLATEHELDRAFPLRLRTERIATTRASLTGQDSLLTLGDGTNAEPSDAEQGRGAAGGEEEAGSAEGDSGGRLPSDGVSDIELRRQIERLEGGSRRPSARKALGAGDESVVPSLMQPPIPFAQVMIAFLYVLPISFVSVFFTSSFMEEKTGRRISVLLSAPVTPLQIILGKMLPYAAFSIVSVMGMTLVLGGSILLSLAVFLPVILFVFAIYLMVPLVYRTFRDTTFVSMLATTVIISYLVFPAMFSGVNDMAYMSPLTLGVKMYQGKSFELAEYLFATAPMYLVFTVALYVGTRVLNEEFLMGFRPLYRKIANAVYLTMWHDRPYASVTLLSAFLIPIVYAVELVVLAVSLNLPLRHAVAGLLIAAVVVEEVAKSIGIIVLLEERIVHRWTEIIGLSFASAVGFLLAEKLLLLLSLSVVSESPLAAVLFSSGMFIIPLFGHFLFTVSVCLLKARWGIRYRFALLAGAALHALYNLAVLWGMV
jgi:ABC-type Na+ efflux pump permease subunit